MKLLLKYFSSFLLFACAFLSVAETITHSVHKPEPLSYNIFTLNGQLAFTLTKDEVLNKGNLPWNKLENEVVYANEGKNWFYLTLSNNTNYPINNVVLIEGKQLLFNELLFMQLSEHGYQAIKTERNIENQIYANITIQPEQDINVLIYIESTEKQLINIANLPNSEFVENTLFHSLAFGVVIGGILVLSLCLMIIFIFKNSLAIFLLSGYLFFQALILVVLNGITVNSFLPNSLEMLGIELPLLFSLSSICLLWFSSEFFKSAYSHPNLHRVYQAVGWLLLSYIAASLFLTNQANLIACHIIHFLVSSLLLALAYCLFKDKEKHAMVFVFLIVIQTLLYVINTAIFGVLAFNLTLFCALYIFTDLLFVFMLSRQISLQIEEKHLAQREALESAMESRQAHEELVILQNENQEQLESRVQERTLELNIALQELEEANRELEQKNTFDDLTGLYNRRFYDQKLLAEFRRSRRNLTPLSLVVIDIDHFKQVNDTYGHSAGDKCLVNLGQLIKQVLRRSSDIGCRYGGEEFCLILPETDSQGAISFAEELRELVMSRAFELDTTSIKLTISCGVSTYQQQKDIVPVDIFNEADKALYKAKTNGRNQVQVAEF